MTRSPSCAPAAALAGRPVSRQRRAAAGEMEKVPLAEREWAASVAVTVCDPAVLRVTANACWPASGAAKAKAAGRTGWPSVEVNATVPEYERTVLPKVSLAVTVVERATPAVPEAPDTSS